MSKTLLSVTALFLTSLAIFFVYQINYNNTKFSKKENVLLENGARLIWQECWFKAPDFADCARLHTAPEEKGQASAFSLPVVILRHQGFNHRDDPIIFLAGGPGAGTGLAKGQIEEFWLSWYKESNLHHDLVLFDQRGTGLSKPALNCPKYHQLIRESFIRDIPTAEKKKVAQEALQECHKGFVEKGIPLEQISTLYSASDVKDLMNVLDYPKWILQGVSYGTRLAIVVEQQNSNRISSMALDSAYPIQKHFFREWPSLLDSSLKKIFSYCDHNSTCKQDYGNIETKFWETMAALKKDPLAIRVTESSLKLDKVVINDDAFIDFLFDSQYESGSLYDMPAVIDAFSHRDHELLTDYVNGYLLSRLQDSVSEVVFRAVECKDNPPLTKQEVTTLYSKYPKLKAYLATEYNDCELWGKSSTTNNIGKLTKQSQVPILILAGEDDPVTPVDWVADVLKQYPNAEYFSFPHISHSVMDKKKCAIDLFSQFIDDPKTRPTADCREVPF